MSQNYRKVVGRVLDAVKIVCASCLIPGDVMPEPCFEDKSRTGPSNVQMQTHAQMSGIRGDSSTLANPSSPDVHSSSDAYAKRFASRAGSYFLQTQLRAVQRLIEPWPGATVLDVGGGHAQIAPALVESGHHVTIQGSDESCRQRPDRLLGAQRYDFLQGDPLALPVEDQSYDVAISVRMMAHVSDPELFVSELCRVARKAVVIDFSGHAGLLSMVSQASYRAKNWAEHNTTRQYNNQSRDEVEAMFRGAGFTPDRHIAQYMWPMVLHRKLNLPVISRGLEAAARYCGLTSRFGSPVLLRARR